METTERTSLESSMHGDIFDAFWNHVNAVSLAPNLADSTAVIEEAARRTATFAKLELSALWKSEETDDLAIKSERLANVRNRIAFLRGIMAPLVMQALQLRKELNTAELNVKLGDEITPGAIMALDPDSIPEEWVNKIQNWLRERGLFWHGTWTATNQMSLHICMDGTRPCDHQMTALEFLPYVEPFDDYRQMGVMDHPVDPSDDSVLRLQFSTKTSQAFLVELRGDVTKIRVHFNSSEDALRYVHEKFPYVDKILV